MTSARDAVIVGSVRTPIGKRGGALADVHPSDLLGLVTNEVLRRTGTQPGDVDQILTGCVTQVGEQAYNIARTSALAAGIPAEVPGTTMDAQCGSSQQAVNLAAALVGADAAEVVLASGVESMSRVPLGAASKAGPGEPFTDAYRDRWEIVAQGESAERIADRWHVDRKACDAWGLRSQQRAAHAWAEGRFDDEIVPVTLPDGSTMSRDEGPRPSTEAGLAALRPAFRPDGRHTAGTSSQISDGDAAVLLMSRRRAEAAGLDVQAVVRAQAMVAVDPVIKLTGPIPATQTLLERQGLVVDDVDLFEVNEAFASVVLAWLAELKAPEETVNVNGGAIALGHPVGATGARLITTMVHEMKRRAAQRGVVTMCCGGGLGTASLLEAT